MSRSPSEGPGRSLEWVRPGLVARLRERRTELEETVLARVLAMSEPVGDEDAEYVTGMRAAVTAAVELTFDSIEQGEEWSGPIPPAAAAQARRAARYGVSLDTVLRRYAAGDRLLADFVMEEADSFPGHALRHILRTQGVLIDRLMASIATEYMQEVERVRRSPEQRRSERVQALLTGAPVGSAGLNYEFEAWHVGLVANGIGATKALEGLKDDLGCQLLSVSRWDESVWAWLGGQRGFAIGEFESLLAERGVTGLSLATGEVAKGLDGWRMTHWQAQRALWVALRSPQMVTRYADVLLLAPVLRDDVLARSLKEIYLAPLGGQRDGGAASRETLRTYFAVGRNAATAAVVLKVDRHTVKRRLHKIEESLGRALHTCQAELEVALRLEALGDIAGVDTPLQTD